VTDLVINQITNQRGNQQKSKQPTIYCPTLQCCTCTSTELRLFRLVLRNHITERIVGFVNIATCHEKYIE